VREYSLEMDVEALSRGVRNDNNVPVDTLALQDCYNFRATERGLEAPKSITAPSTGATESLTWPLPQVFRLRQLTLAFFPTKVYTVNEGGNSKTEIATVNNNGVWHVADMFGAWAATNGSRFVYTSTPATDTIGTSIAAEVKTSPTIQTCCFSRGRVVFGGFQESTAFGLWNSLGPNFVCWSSIGGGDVYYPWGGSVTDEQLSAIKEKLSFGQMPMPSQGTVLCVKPLGKNVMVYSEDSVNLLVLTSDPISTYGLGELDDVGVLGRGAVAGNDKVHFFVSKNKELWRIDANYNVQKMRFSNVLSNMAAGTIVGAFDPGEKDTYFSNGTDGVVITKSGVSRIARMPTGLYVSEGGVLKGLTKESAETEDIAYAIVSDLELKSRGGKTLHIVESSMEDMTDAEASVNARYKGGSFDTGPAVLFNPEGVAFPRTTAHEFRIKIKGDVSGTQKVDYIKAAYQVPDKRFKRGLRK
jgi:hypothetical protein